MVTKNNLHHIYFKKKIVHTYNIMKNSVGGLAAQTGWEKAGDVKNEQLLCWTRWQFLNPRNMTTCK
jgi:hypothetical protein